MLTNRFAALGVLALLLALVVPLAQAQELTQSFTSADGTLSLAYPGDWTAQEFFGTILLANSDEAANVFLEGGDLAPGQVLVALLTPTAVVENMSMSGDAPAETPEDLLVAFTGDMEMTGTLETDTIGDKAVARTTAEEEGQLLVAYAVDLGEGGMALVVQVTLPGEEGAPEGTTRAIIESLEAQKLAEPTESGTVVWQQLMEVSEEPVTGEGFGSVDDVVVGPDDTIYVLDTFVGVHVFDAEGNDQGIITRQDSFGTMNALAVDADGALWTVDFMGTMTRFDASGATLTSFDISDNAELSFFGVALAVGPDGSLYLLNPRDTEEQAIAEVLVFSTEGELLRTFEVGSDEYFYEASLAFGPQGNLYVAEHFGEDGIKVFDAEGNLLREGIGISQLYNTAGIAVGADGSIYTAISDSPIYHFASDGTLLGRFGQSQFMQQDLDFDADTLPPLDPGVFFDIGGMALLSNGDLIVADASSDWWQLVRVSFSE